ncbi:MAG TPA: hypothetical protein VGF59_25475 [Bryobacteraceae bacterium]
MALASAGTQYALAQLSPAFQNGDVQALPTAFLAADLGYRFLFGIAGGWIAAAIAQRWMASMGMAVLAFLLGLAPLLAFDSRHWYHVSAPLLCVFAAVLGGYAWTKTARKPEPLV